MSQVKPALILALTDVCSIQFVVASTIRSILLTKVQDTWTLITPATVVKFCIFYMAP